MPDERLKNLRLSAITIDEGLQPRAGGLNDAHIADLVAALEDGADLPPLVVYQNAANSLLLSEGFHRAEAYKRHGVKQVPCVVRKGERADALANACGSNASHGLKRTNADKRRAVELLVAAFPVWSNRKIAEAACVHHDLVTTVRRAIELADSATSTREGKDGKQYPPKAKPEERSNIGQPATVAGCDPAGASNQVPTVGTSPDEPPQEDAVSDPEHAPADDTSEPVASGVSIIFPTAEEPEPEPAPGKPSKPAPVVDGWGIPIQEHAAEAFALVPKFRELVQAIQHAQRLFNEVTTAPGGEFLRLPSASSYRRGKRNGDDYADRYVHTGLEQCLQHVKAAVPNHTVCPYQFAEGGHPADCRTCLNLKWTPELSSSVPPVCIDRAKAAFNVTDQEAA